MSRRSASANHTRHALVSVFKLALLAAALYFVITALVERFGAVSWKQIRVEPRFAFLSATSLIVAYSLRAFAYGVLLASLGHRLPWSLILSIHWIQSLGKYVPGKVAAFAGSVWMLGRVGVPAPIGASANIILPGLNLTTGLLIGLPLTLWQPVQQAIPLAWLWSGILVLVGVACLHPFFFGTIGNYALKWLGKPSITDLPDLRSYSMLAVLQGTVWTLSGLALWLLARSVGDVPAEQIPVFVAGSAIATTAGIFAVFAPAGLGVRDYIMLAVLSPAMGPGAAIVTVAMRLLDTSVEVLLAGFGIGILRLRPRGSADGEPAIRHE